MAYVERGPLVFALPLAAKHYPWEYESHGVTRKAPYCDWIILSEQDWGYAFAEKDFQLVENPLGDQPFSREQPPLQLVTRMNRSHGAPVPVSPAYDAGKSRKVRNLSGRNGAAAALTDAPRSA